MLSKIFDLFKKIVISAFLLYGYNIIVAPLGLIVPINTKNPVRIEFWGDQIDSIREFDVDTQLTIKKINELEILPCTEFLTNTNIDNYDIKQKYLVKYGNVVNIVDYLNNPLVIFENYQQIKFSKCYKI